MPNPRVPAPIKTQRKDPRETALLQRLGRESAPSSTQPAQQTLPGAPNRADYRTGGTTVTLPERGASTVPDVAPALPRRVPSRPATPRVDYREGGPGSFGPRAGVEPVGDLEGLADILARTSGAGALGYLPPVLVGPDPSTVPRSVPMPAVPPTAQGPTVPPESLGSLTPEEMALMQRIESLRAMTQPGYVATPEELALLQRLFPGRL